MSLLVAHLVLMQLLPMPWRPGEVSSFERGYTAAWRAFEDGDYARAVSILTVVNRRWPGHPLAQFTWYMEARLRLWNGDATGATGTMRLFLARYPSSPYAPEMRSRLRRLDGLLDSQDRGLVARWLRMMGTCPHLRCADAIRFVRAHPSFPGNTELASCAEGCIASVREGAVLAGHLPEERRWVYAADGYMRGRIRTALALAPRRLKGLILLDLLLRGALILLLAWGAFAFRRTPRSPESLLLVVASVVLAAWKPASFGLLYATAIHAVTGSRRMVVVAVALAVARYVILLSL